jgi:alpha-L-fucosidase 2
MIPALLLLLATLTDVEFARPDGVPLRLDASIPDSPRPQPAVVLVHGGGWEAGDKRTYIRPWFDVLTRAGVAWFSVDYRLAPEWKHPAAVEDVEAAVRWVRANARKYRIDPERIAIMGESAGGHLAALVALRARVSVAALVSFYGVHDLRMWADQRNGLPRNISLYLPDTRPATLREASPSSYISPSSPPMLLIHGTADKGVPFAQSTTLCKAARRCELLLIQGAPHGVEAWEPEPGFHVWKPKLIEWLRRVLGD